jgi:hypothetical protein
MSEIQVNTINEYTGANGVTIDGLTIKDGAITAGNPITETETWRLTTNFTGDATPIASNLSLASDAGKIGTGMTQSSGIFTFPSTGIYKIFFQPMIVNSGVNNTDNYIRALIETTNNNSTYTTRGQGANDISGSNHYTFMNISYIFDVTDTANDKVRFTVSEMPSNTSVFGSSGENKTYIEFIRLGDT